MLEEIRKVGFELSHSTESVKPREKRLLSVISMAAVAVILLAAGSYVYRAVWSPPPSGQEEPGIVILPFENLGEAEDEYFADGITDEINVRLTAVSYTHLTLPTKRIV